MSDEMPEQEGNVLVRTTERLPFPFDMAVGVLVLTFAITVFGIYKDITAAWRWFRDLRE